MKSNGFGERLKALLKQKNLTQAQVAAAIRTSVPSVNRWTKGGEIEYPNLRALADYLDVNWIWLRYGDEAIASLRDKLPDNNLMTDMRREYLDDIMANEAKMKSVLDMADIVHWEWNVLTGTVICSDNAERVFNVKDEDLPNCMMPFIDSPVEQLIETFGQSQPHVWDFSVATPEGGEKWFTSKAKLIFDAVKRPIKVIGISSDITARKRAEQALEESEYMMRKIIELIPVGLWAADAEGNICLANPEVQRIWGGAKYVGLEHYGEYKGWWEDSGEAVGAEGWTLARAIRTGEVSEAEVVNIEAFDGEHRTITMYSAPLYDKNQKIIGAIEVNQDITELKTIERSLKSSLNEWEVIFEQSMFAVFQSYNGKISRMNQAAASELKLQPDSEPSLEDLFSAATLEVIARATSTPALQPQLLSAELKNRAHPLQLYLLPQRLAPGDSKILFLAPVARAEQFA